MAFLYLALSFPFSCSLPPGLGFFVDFFFVVVAVVFFFPPLAVPRQAGQGLGLLLVGFLFIHLFHLHPPVLKPDFDLPLGEVENPGHLIPTVPG